jgi:hypothetical protein
MTRVGLMRCGAQFFSVKPAVCCTHGKLLYEVCLIRIKEHGAHRNVDYLLKNTFTKHNKYVVNQNLKHFDDINFRVLFGFGRIVLVFIFFFFFTK